MACLACLNKINMETYENEIFYKYDTFNKIYI